MTVLIGTARTLELGTDGQENNPSILWNNLATAANISSVTGVATDGAVSNAVNGTTFDYAMPLVSGSNSAALSVSTLSGAVNAGAIAAHNIGTLGATVALNYSDDGGSSWNDCGAGSIAPTDDDVILWRFPSVSGVEWRLIITGIVSGQPAIGVFVLGEELVLPRRIYQGYTPPLTPTNVTLQSNVSEGGHLLGNAYVRAGSNLQVELRYLEDSFVRGTDWLAFQEHFNSGKGFFWAWRPAKYDDAYYCWRSGGPIVPVNSGPLALMSAGFAARAYHE